MSNPWKRVDEPVTVRDLSEIMIEEMNKSTQAIRETKCTEQLSHQPLSSIPDGLSAELQKETDETNLIAKDCDSDETIAQLLQHQLDKEYNNELKRLERKQYGDSKVSVSYHNYITEPAHVGCDSDSENEDTKSETEDSDNLNINYMEIASHQKRGFVMKDGEILTKHDSVITGFDTEQCNSMYFNHLKRKNRQHIVLDHKILDVKESHFDGDIDEPTRLLLSKLLKMQLFNDIKGVIAKEKDSVILYADGNKAYCGLTVPKECAIKVFKTDNNTLRGYFKFIEADHRFKDRFSREDHKKVVHMWAEKEMLNILRMQKIGLNCPNIVCLYKHILVMSIIGNENKPAIRLKDLQLAQWEFIYGEVIKTMRKLYRVGHLIHTDLSEHNILWWDKKCYFINVARAIQPDHPRALKFLWRDCQNIINFFKTKNVWRMTTAEALFRSLTGLNDVDINTLKAACVRYNLKSSQFEVVPGCKIVDYPLESYWQKLDKRFVINDEADGEVMSEKNGAKEHDSEHERLNTNNVLTTKKLLKKVHFPGD